MASSMLSPGVSPRPSPLQTRMQKGPQLPFLPGYVPYDNKGEGKHSKMQTLAYAPGGAIANMKTEIPPLNMNVLQQISNPTFRFNYSQRSATHDERSALKESARNTYKPAIAPSWLKHDRQVLRFSAYFQEPVHESPKENFRVRPCVLYFYLEDGTMMVTEPKVENSGIPQGVFIKRHRISRPEELGGGYYEPSDLRIGVSLVIYSRAFRIVDCDDFTREFYAKAVGEDVGQPEDTPLDSFRISQLDSSQDSARIRAATNPAIIESKQYAELLLGGARSNNKLQQYLENDRKVLLFKCYWDDPTRYGCRLYYTLHYYLADDTVEMLENLPRNSGRDPYPIFWRRSPLQKNPHINPAPAMLEPEHSYFRPEDFVVGDPITVYGRQIYLYDCDDFTRDFYLRYTGIPQTRIPVDTPQPEHVQLTHAPHTGFGEEEDALASCLHLTPKAPRRDILRLLGLQGQVLRFQGEMSNSKPEDANRRFVIAIFPADDSVGVWELRQRNSGHAEGKFASKGRKRNPATDAWFVPEDFRIGAVVEINRMPFKLSRADDCTLKFMEKNPGRFPCADVRRICAKLKGLERELTEMGDMVSPDDLRSLAEARLKVSLSPHEMVTLRRACGVMQDDAETVTDEADECFDAAEAPAVIETRSLVKRICG